MVVVRRCGPQHRCRSVVPLWQVTAAAGPRSDFATGVVVRRNRSVRGPPARHIAWTITREQVLAFRVHAQELDADSRPPRPTRRCSTSACRTPDPTARPGPWRCAAPPPTPTTCSPRGRCAGRRTSTAASQAAQVATRGGSVLGGRRRQAGLRRLQAAEGGRDHGARRPRPDRRGDARHRGDARWSRARCRPSCTDGCPSPTSGGAGSARPSTSTSSRSAWPRCGAVSSSRPGTSPPVLQRIPGWRGPAKRADPTLDVVRGVLRLLGPATPKQVAEYVDAPVKDVKARWPDDVVPVVVDGAEQVDPRVDDVAALAAPPDVSSGLVRLLGPFDLFLQSRDRELVVPEEAEPQGPVAHHRPSGRRPGRPRGPRHLAAARLGQEAAHRGERVGPAPRPHRAGRAARRLPRA